jgi:hypothetical protein
MIEHYSVTLDAMLFSNNKMVIAEKTPIYSYANTLHMKKNEIHPELLNIDRMKSKPFTKKDFEGVSAFIKKYKEKMAAAEKKRATQKQAKLNNDQ